MKTFRDNFLLLDFLTLVALLFVNAYAKITELSVSKSYNATMLFMGISFWLISIFRIRRSFRASNYQFAKKEILKHWDISLYCFLLFVSFTLSPIIRTLDMVLGESEGIITFSLLVASITPFRYFHEAMGYRESVNILHTQKGVSQKTAA